MASDFLFAVAVDGVIMSGQVIAAAEDCITWFVGRRIILRALVGTRGVVAGHVVLSRLRVVAGGGGRGVLR
jgi:hypothetical protein